MYINVSKSFETKIEKLIKKAIFSRKEEVIEAACALGLVYNEKKTPTTPISLELSYFDEYGIFSIVAAARNPKLLTRNDVLNELEKYIEAGSSKIDEKFNFYEQYCKVKELA
jgi:hypothetical protein